MNKLLSRFSLLICGLLMSSLLFAQDNATKPEMADIMRSNGKIYVVVAVCLIILIGLFLYVTTIDRKVRRMEKGE
jgi:K+-transporting ATPase A subunit